VTCVNLFLIVFQGQFFADTLSIGGTSNLIFRGVRIPVSIHNAETGLFAFRFRPGVQKTVAHSRRATINLNAGTGFAAT